MKTAIKFEKIDYENFNEVGNLIENTNYSFDVSLKYDDYTVSPKIR